MFTAKERTALASFRGVLEETQAAIEELFNAAKDRFEARSDRWKEGDAGQTAESEISAAEQAASYCENAIDQLSEIDGVSGV